MSVGVIGGAGGRFEQSRAGLHLLLGTREPSRHFQMLTILMRWGSEVRLNMNTAGTGSGRLWGA